MVDLFEDILSQPKPKRIVWDIKKYETDGAYCPGCGSKKFTIVKDQLLSDHMQKDIRCQDCGTEWQEIWDKDIELDLKELRINCN